MRVCCFIFLFLAGSFGLHAQTTGQDRPEAGGVHLSSHGKTTAGRGFAIGALSPAGIFRRSEAATSVPDRDGIEFAVQLLPEPFRIPNTQLETISWSEMRGWAEDDHSAAFAAFLNSCKAIVRGAPPRRAGQTFYTALQSACRRAINFPARNAQTARIFFERNFRPMRIAPLGEDNGFLTGYYEPIIEGSRVKSAEFNVPLYRTPPEIAGRASPGAYYDRTAIEEGALAGRKLEICWIKDPTDLLFAQIQGSARVRLEDGKVMRLNYSGHNGWKYTPIGRILIAREIVPKEEISMDRIREWILANPKEGKELRRHNKSYVFFRETGLAEHEEPIGAQGISLMPGRSIAVDKSIHIYGTLFFIEAELPLENERSENMFQRLMVSQDTGSAIIGPARADLYFGSVPGSSGVAGRIRHPGKFTILIPREIDPLIAGRQTPLPHPRPDSLIADSKTEKKAKLAPNQKPEEISEPKREH